MYLQPCVVLLIAAVFVNLGSVYIYLGIHGCVDQSFFIHMVFLKPHYSLCILSNKLLQMIYYEFLMVGFLTSFGGDFSAIHQSLSDQSNNLIINSSKKLHSQTPLCVQSRSHVQGDVHTCSAASSITKKKEKEGTQYTRTVYFSHF